ncbi:helix-turn-helix domain-containing protein [Halorussus salilacus]|uniref:winged helix-turn-helix domain-containing protein n=1 Tax=Halorussus salilacus TaxID=2953750 RepID=UPI0020A18697|nr:winged helix-turn-helix domain-containing protein [Halorussus salilacus]USZ67293.1 helix-turn-helix domain-containing protein [Halorussus salilacus]
MARSESDSRKEGPSPRQIVPEQSLLDLQDYLDMQSALGNEIRFRVLYTLNHEGPKSAKDLRTGLGVAGNTLHYHLDELMNVGLVENRVRNEPEKDGVYSYYRASAMGEALLEEGIEELIRRDWKSLDRYS